MRELVIHPCAFVVRVGHFMVLEWERMVQQLERGQRTTDVYGGGRGALVGGQGDNSVPFCSEVFHSLIEAGWHLAHPHIIAQHVVASKYVRLICSLPDHSRSPTPGRIHLRVGYGEA